MRVFKSKDLRDGDECTPLITQHQGLVVTFGYVGHFSHFQICRSSAYTRIRQLWVPRTRSRHATRRYSRVRPPSLCVRRAVNERLYTLRPALSVMEGLVVNARHSNHRSGHVPISSSAHVQERLLDKCHPLRQRCCSSASTEPVRNELGNRECGRGTLLTITSYPAPKCVHPGVVVIPITSAHRLGVWET
jgi:hypothetical protein